MLLDAEDILAALRERQEADLAILALFAALTGEPPERAWGIAADRCKQASVVLRESHPPRPNTLHGGRRGRGRPLEVLAYVGDKLDEFERWQGVPPGTGDIALRAARIADRAEGALRQVHARYEAGVGV